MNIKNYDWYRGCLQKATMKLIVNGKCYWLTRTEHPEENYFKVDGDVETENIGLAEYKEKLNEIFAYDEVSLRRLREFVEENMSYEMSDMEDYEERGSDESIQIIETEEDYYMMSTSLTAEQVEQFAVEIKNDILKYNWDALAEKISYPIVISGITVNNREDFLKIDIDRNLNSEFVEAISAETCRKMFCNWQGVMMGNTGQIWFSNVDNGNGTSELLIIGINDMFEIEMSSIGY